MQAEREGTDTAHCGAVARLRAQIDDLEATMATQEGELSVLRCEEGRARHDCAVLQHTCADLHTQVRPPPRARPATNSLHWYCRHRRMWGLP